LFAHGATISSAPKNSASERRVSQSGGLAGYLCRRFALHGIEKAILEHALVNPAGGVGFDLNVSDGGQPLIEHARGIQDVVVHVLELARVRID
jgi:hypothetical protein